MELDPFDYSFLKKLPREYQELDGHARHRYILNCLIQQFYQLGNEHLNEAHKQAVASLYNNITPEIKRFHQSLTLAFDSVNEFRSKFRKKHGSKLALINKNFTVWHNQRIEKFGVEIIKRKQGWH